MKKYIILFFFLCSQAISAPVIDPTTCFSNYPFTGMTNQTWYTAETNNHAIKQIWYSLEDRARAAGYEDLPAYQREFSLYASVKTNWTYTNWMYFGNGLTNNTLTNYMPTLQLVLARSNENHISVMDTNPPTLPAILLWNQVTNFTHLTPTNWDVNYSGLQTVTDQVVIPRAMLTAITNTIETICTSYIPASCSNISVLTNYPGIPKYCMAGLLIDAGLEVGVTVTNKDAWGIVTNGTWKWPNPLPNSNSIITLAALTDVASTIAQLKRTILPGVGCSPYRLQSAANIGPTKYGWANLTTVTLTNNTLSAIFDNPVRFPFAWMQTSTDLTWGTTLVMQNAWTNGCSTNERSALAYSLTRHSDWDTTDWPAQTLYDMTYSVHRDTTNDPVTYLNYTNNGGWLFDVGSVLSITTNQTTISPAGVQTFLTSPYSGSLQITSLWTAVDSWQFVAEHTEYYVENYKTIRDISTFATTNFNHVSILTNASPTSEVYIATGYYQTRTNDNPAGTGNWFTVTKSVNFTNTDTHAPLDIVTSNFTAYSYSNYPVFNTEILSTNKPWYSEVIPDYYRYNWPGGSFGQSNWGDVAYSYSGMTNGVWTFAALYSIRTQPQRYLSGTLAGTGYLYCIGGELGCREGQTSNTSARAVEWTTNYNWSFSAASEIGLIDNQAINLSTYTNIWTATLPDDLVIDDSYANILIYSQMVVNARIPYENITTNSRMFWAISNAVWLIDYTFPVRW